MTKNLFLVGGLAALLTFGLAGCGDGVDQDNGISDGEQKDQLDTNTEQEAEKQVEEGNENLEEAKKNVEETLKEEGIEAKKNVEENLQEQ
ncbi:hypothetical protein R4Z10_19210 [Niallia sp. XMNu-256]|uniref:hypothetical protein n=1 Tax=Niallia sp. XMNu-256 TaxID=3082444 RepID=UPI0030D536E0